MFLTQLNLSQFRHFPAFQLKPAAGFNFIFGPNGSGKSSLLEAIYVLSMGRSFRSKQLTPLIRHHCAEFQVIGSWKNIYDRQFTVGIGRQSQISDIRLDGQPIHSLRDLVSLVPVQLINHECFHLVDAGPQCRREFLDWGVFHSEPSFFNAWQRYQRALKQRNAGLKRHLPLAELNLWQQELVLQAESIHALRTHYFQGFLPHVERLLSELLALDQLTIDYYPGWDVALPLATVFNKDYERDCFLGHTQHGPHRADIKIKVKGIEADHLLSRGQQKLLSYTLRLAQSECLKMFTGKHSVLLIDDLAAELDGLKVEKVLQLLLNLNCQVFITGVDESLVIAAAKAVHLTLFHVEHLS